MTRVFNNKRNRVLRSELRNNMTEPERRLWSKLRGRQLGVKFRRQFGIGQYIVDFYSPEQRLVIEVDGNSHFSEAGFAYDLVRDEYINSLGIRILRFTNQQVMHNMDGVLLVIVQALKTPSQPPPW